MVSTEPSSIPREQRALPRNVWLFLIALYAACAGASLLTRDFGFYFDDKIHIGALRVTFESGVPLPRTYHYPSLSYLVTLIAALPSWAAHGFDRSAFAGELSAALEGGLAYPPRVLLDARALFAAIAYLAIFWTALLAWRLSRSSLAACGAALALALSFECHYHARICAPDAMMAQFVLLSVLFAQRYLGSARRRDLIAAAAAAGLAAGTKFPGALALTAVGVASLALEFAAAADTQRVRALWRTVRTCALALGVLVVVFLLTTPGVVFDTELVRKDVAIELRHYRGEGSAGAHAPYDVRAGWDHLRRLCVYVAGQGLSYAMPAALLLFALGSWGVLRIWRRDRVGAAVSFAVPLLYVVYFSYQRVMVVRNFEVLLPFLAIGVGLGVRELFEPKVPRSVRACALATVALALTWNLQFLVRADLSVMNRRQIDVAAALREFVESSSEPVFLAPHARELLEPQGASTLVPEKIAIDPRSARYAIVLQGDLADMVARPGFSKNDLRANWPQLYQPLPQGPWEVNFSYYPSWKGDARALRITSEYYRTLIGER